MKSILIVDDDAQLAESLATRCRGIGLTAVTAKNLFTALAILENSRPDLLCVDVHLPTGNGLNMCDLLVADPRVSHIPIIVLTGCRKPQTIQRCRDLRAHYVHKSPSLWDRVEPIIRQLIEVTPPVSQRSRRQAQLT